MKYISLGKTGLKVSCIWLGTWQFGSGSWGYGKSYSEKDCVEAIIASLEAGVNVIDTAEVYGAGVSEQIIGKTLKEYGDDVLVATKVAPHHLSYGEVLKACERSLKRLGVRTIDLYQIHFPNPLIPISQTMKAMEKLVKDGKIMHIGVSNFSLKQLVKAREALKSEDIVSNQVRYNLIQREIEKELYPYCVKEKITILAYSPLAQGVLTGRYGPQNLPRDIIRRINPLFGRRFLSKAQPLFDALKKLAEKYGATPGQIALSWITSRDENVAIAGAKNREQATINAAAGKIVLTPEEVSKLSELSDKAKPDFVDAMNVIPRLLGF
ncbi:MAG: aldo/keto reductase [Candidatus Caldarchaeum sp.]|nr:aldo/keto reductase [Candidatus Caldarchaeum sp.]